MALRIFYDLKQLSQTKVTLYFLFKHLYPHKTGKISNIMRKKTILRVLSKTKSNNTMNEKSILNH